MYFSSPSCLFFYLTLKCRVGIKFCSGPSKLKYTSSLGGVGITGAFSCPPHDDISQICISHTYPVSVQDLCAMWSTRETGQLQWIQNQICLSQTLFPCSSFQWVVPPSPQSPMTRDFPSTLFLSSLATFIVDTVSCRQPLYHWKHFFSFVSLLLPKRRPSSSHVYGLLFSFSLFSHPVFSSQAGLSKMWVWLHYSCLCKMLWDFLLFLNQPQALS